MTQEQLKSRAYDLIVLMNQAQAELQKINEELYRLENQPIEQPVNDDAKPMNE